MPSSGILQLNPQQQAAVEHEYGPMEVIAGPGAGKTLILVERAARLLERGQSLSGIVLVTFTRRAAGEMRHRLQLRLGFDVGAHSLRNVCTIHALAYRILRTAMRKSGRPGWHVADEEQDFEALRQAMKELDVPREIYTPKEMARNVRSLQGLPPDINPLTEEIVLAVYRRYQKILIKHRKWSLGDLIPSAMQALNKDSLLGSLFGRLCIQLMVDEWQDVSLVEYGFLKQLLRGDNLFVVGSPAQSIYSWRHAHYEELSQQLRTDFPHLQTLALEVNYRSTEQIAMACRSLLPHDYTERKIKSIRGVGPELQVHLSYDPNAEANQVAQLLQNYHDQEALSYEQMAVLFRVWRHASTLEQALVAQGVPYSLNERLRFYERPEVRELIAYLLLARALANNRPEHEDESGALEAVINAPPRGLGPNALHRLRDGMPNLTWELFLAGIGTKILPEQARQGCRELFDLLSLLSRSIENRTPKSALDQILELSGYRQWLEEDYSAGRSLHVIEALQREAGGYQRLDAFLHGTRSRMRARLDWQPQDHGVTLSTIHGAKGMEWPLVIVIGLYEGSLPHVMAQQAGAMPDPPEERRLAYVAFSRAIDRLHLTLPRHIQLNGSLMAVPRSRYLDELPEGCKLLA